MAAAQGRESQPAAAWMTPQTMPGGPIWMVSMNGGPTFAIIVEKSTYPLDLHRALERLEG